MSVVTTFVISVAKVRRHRFFFLSLGPAWRTAVKERRKEWCGVIHFFPLLRSLISNTVEYSVGGRIVCGKELSYNSWHLLSACYSKHIICINSFDPHDNHVAQQSSNPNSSTSLWYKVVQLHCFGVSWNYQTWGLVVAWNEKAFVIGFSIWKNSLTDAKAHKTQFTLRFIH